MNAPTYRLVQHFLWPTMCVSSDCLVAAAHEYSTMDLKDERIRKAG